MSSPAGPFRATRGRGLDPAREKVRDGGGSRTPIVKTLSALLCLALAACASDGSSDRDASGAPRPLVVVSDIDNAPFAYMDESGTPNGFEPALVAAVGECLGRPIRWERMPFERLLDAVASGQADMACATLGITPERRQKVLFSRPYFETELLVLVRAEPDAANTLSELADRRVLASAATTSERAVRMHLPRAVGVFDKTEQTAAERLRSGDVDAIVMDGPAAEDVLAREPGVFRRLIQRLGRERYAMAVPPTAKQLKADIDRCLEEISTSGRLFELATAHGVHSDTSDRPPAPVSSQ